MNAVKKYCIQIAKRSSDSICGILGDGVCGKLLQQSQTSIEY